VTVAGRRCCSGGRAITSRRIVSSQVELQGPQIKDGFISVTAKLRVQQPALSNSSIISNPECRSCSSPFGGAVAVGRGCFRASGAPGAPGGKMRVLISVSRAVAATK